MSRCIDGVVGTLVATFATASLLIAPARRGSLHCKLQSLNADKIGRSASGTASFEIKDGNWQLRSTRAGLRPAAAYAAFSWISGRQRCRVPDLTADVNGDGYVDCSRRPRRDDDGAVPRASRPEIPSDTYPVAIRAALHYQKTESVEKLERLQEKFKAPGLALASGSSSCTAWRRHQAAGYSEITSRRACADDAAGSLRSHRGG